jgi:hypothetical protein
MQWIMLAKIDKLSLFANASLLWKFNNADLLPEVRDVFSKAIPLWYFLYDDVMETQKSPFSAISAANWFGDVAQAIERSHDESEFHKVLERANIDEDSGLFTGQKEVSMILSVLWNCKPTQRVWLELFCRHLEKFAYSQGREIELRRRLLHPPLSPPIILEDYINFRGGHICADTPISLMGICADWPSTSEAVSLVQDLQPLCDNAMNFYNDAYSIRGEFDMHLFAEGFISERRAEEAYETLEKFITVGMADGTIGENHQQIIIDIVHFVYVTNHIITPKVYGAKDGTDHSRSRGESICILSKKTITSLEERLKKLF